MSSTHKRLNTLDKINKCLKDVTLRRNQKAFSELIKDNSVIFCTGPAGTSKTFTALYTALQELLDRDSTIDNIVLSKPIQESGEKLGLLPGTVEEKIEPHIQSYVDNIKTILNFELYNELWDDKITFEPIAYLRGRSLRRSIVLIDEAQNMTYKQLMLTITRLGEGSKIVLMGDVSQYDIKSNDVCLHTFEELFSHIKGVGVHKFTREDIVRNKILIEITDVYEKWKHESGIK